MSDPYRKTMPGQPLAISSRAWNRLLEGTASRNVPAGGGFLAPAPPCLEVTVPLAGWYESTGRQPSLGEAVVIGGVGEWAGAVSSGGVPATLPLANDVALSSNERRVFAGFSFAAEPMLPTSGSTDDRFAICIDPLQRRFAVSGFAWTRVRAIKPWHRFARRCLSQPGDGSTERAAGVGCLDSCGWGRAEIIGYAYVTSGAFLSIGGPPTPASPPSIHWALIRF